MLSVGEEGPEFPAVVVRSEEEGLELPGVVLSGGEDAVVVSPSDAVPVVLPKGDEAPDVPPVTVRTEDCPSVPAAVLSRE